MFLSIIIPIYNDEKYLEECLDSCLHQDIPYDDYEIICVDDGSTDRTQEILREYADHYPNIVLIFNQHQGGSMGRNNGLEAAQGDYVWFVDHDDFIEFNILSYLKDSLQQSQCDRFSFPCYICRSYLSDKEQLARKNGALKPDTVTYRSAIWSNVLKKSFLLEHDIWPKSKLLNGRKVWGADGFFIDETKLANAKVNSAEDRIIYYYRVSHIQQTADHSFKTNMARIEGTIDPVLTLRELYNREVNELGAAREVTANVLMAWAHACMMYLAPMDHHSYVEGKKKAKEAGVFPMRIVPEYNYSLEDCICEHRQKGEGLLKTIGYYYSTYRLGLMLYRATCWKSLLIRAVKASSLGSYIHKS